MPLQSSRKKGEVDFCVSSRKKETGKLDPAEEDVFANEEPLAVVAAGAFGRFFPFLLLE